MADVPIYINPNFNELRGTEVVPDAASHASYLVTGTGASLSCTGTWNAAGFRQRNICLRDSGRARALALTALHSADFDYERPAVERERREQAARQTLMICPKCEPALTDFLNDAESLSIRAGGIGDAAGLIALFRTKAASVRLLLPAAYQGQNPVVEEIAKLGTQIRYVDYEFDGLTILQRNASGETQGLVGSLRLTQSSLWQSREVAVLLTGEDAIGLSQIWSLEWQRGRPY